MIKPANVAIIGAGPAGLQAAISASSELDDVVLIDKSNTWGGAAGTSSHIENIAGYDESGLTIVNRMAKAAKKHGTRFVLGQKATRIESDPTTQLKTVELENRTYLTAKAIILALGLKQKCLNIPGESTYFGRDIMYGSVLSKVRACRGLPIAIIGGANSAGQLAMYAADFASYVSIIIRGESIDSSMSAYLHQRVTNNPKIGIINHSTITQADGDKRLQTITYTRFDKTETIQACALFVIIGSEPQTGWLPTEISRNNEGFIQTTGQLKHETGLPGVFSIGDVNENSVKRVGGAIGQGTEVVPSIHEYLRQLKELSNVS